ncbi:unnamed protein product [Effrenium voratum]|nr:unnamed protein product [Effrenium voratum]
MVKKLVVWPKRSPRKPRAKQQAREAPPRDVQQAARRLAPRAARVLPFRSGADIRRHLPRQHASDARGQGGACARLVAGRTPANALKLYSFHIFAPMAPDSRGDAVLPARGLTAKLRGGDVFIIEVFTRWGRKLADVTPIRADGKLGRAQTVRRDELSEVGLSHRIASFSRGAAQLEALDRLDVAALPGVLVQTQSLAARLVPSRLQWPVPASPPDVQVVTPLAASLHGLVLGHDVAARADKSGLKVLLDIPRPAILDCRPHRCTTCRHSDHPEVGNYFRVQDSDLEEQLPQTRVLRLERHGLILATPRLLLWLFQALYEPRRTQWLF